MQSWLLLLRFALINVVAVAVLVAIWLQGWLDDATQGFTGWLIGGIIVVFLYGLGLCGWRIFRTSAELNGVRDGTPALGTRASRYLEDVNGQAAAERSLRANLFRLRLTGEATSVRHVSNTLVFLGLVGTVIGFIFALSGVDPEAASSTDKVAPMISTLISGMSIALYTTLVGAVLHVWLNINYRVLSSGVLALFDETVDLGERRVGR